VCTAFVECFTGASVTHGEVAENAFNCSERLSSELMLKRGDVVALFSLNDVNYFSILLGCMKAGIIVTTVDPDYDANELTQQLKHAQAKVSLRFPVLHHFLQRLCVAATCSRSSI
jgi:acyl-CoA synthetase (AMP-forming)/AMP-acid ligase II